MNKKLFLALPVVLTPITTISCSNVFNQLKHLFSPLKTDQNVEIWKKEVALLNFNQAYPQLKNSKMNLYFIKNNQNFIDSNEDIPYVNFDEMMSTFNRYLNLKCNYYRTYDIYTYKNNYSLLTIDAIKNRIIASDLSAFDSKISPAYSAYSNNLKTVKAEILKEGKDKIVFDLDKYNFDILNYKNSPLIPLSIFNLLFMNLNYNSLYYNNDKVFFVEQWLDDNIKGIEFLRKNSLEGQEQSPKLRKATYDFINFAFDNFYGIKEKWQNWEVKNPKLKESILSTKSNDYNKGYLSLFHQYLNELHTSVTMRSFYDNDDAKIKDLPISLVNSPKNIKYVNRRNELLKLREHYNHDIKNKNNTFFTSRYEDTLRIAFDSFEINTKDENSIENDTFNFVRNALVKATEWNKNNPDKQLIKNIVLDISLNGGGALGAMIKVLGLITDENIKINQVDSLTEAIYTSYYAVDANNDKNFKDKDAFTNFDWYILVGENSFSAANSFTGVVKEMKIATIIGQKTGGGMCSVLPVVLPDGTTLRISSNNCSNIKINNKFEDIEDGIKPHYSYSYSDFYNNEKLKKFIDSIEYI